MDTIVFSKDELQKAVENGYKNIALCDGSFELSAAQGVEYTAIGEVTASIPLSERAAQRRGIRFHGFTPSFALKNSPVYRLIPCPVKPAPQRNGASSYGTSYASSYSSSFMTSYFSEWEYEWEYSTSFSASSFSGSFGTRLRSSFQGSFSGSFRLRSSFISAGSGSAGSSSFRLSRRFRRKYIIKEISVNGYGLNMI